MEQQDAVSVLTAMCGHPGELDWMVVWCEGLGGAECRFDPPLHTGPDPRTTIEDPEARAAREDVAREICQGCPVWATCLRRAVRIKPERGVWAGLTAEAVALLAGLCAEPEQMQDPAVRGKAAA
jgi:WhiB family redox-sensing transcriptional regulator